MESLEAAVAAVGRQWNVLLFIAGLMGLAAAAHESGAFAWITDSLLWSAGGSRRRLFVALFVAAALVTILLSNDATAIVLTPIVYRAVHRRDGEAAPFLFACVFVANAASFGLPFSNPANVLILPHARLLAYLWHLGPPQLAAIAIDLLLFLFFFRRELRGGYAPVPPAAPGARALRTLAIMAGVALAYVAGLALAWPLGPIAAAGGAASLAVSGGRVERILQHFAWKTFALLAALFIVFDALDRAGFATVLLRGLHDAVRYGGLAVDVTASGGAAVLSNLFNNLPVAVAAAYLTQRLPYEHLAYPLIAGVDVGPNLAPTGSLATILWLTTLRRYGVRVDLVTYLRLGALTVPPALAVTVLWLLLVR